MLILAVREPAEKKQLSCGSWCYSKQTIKGHIFGPFLTYTLLFVKGCFFLSDLTYLPHVSSENIGHRYRRTPSLRKDRGERVSLPIFFRGGGICKRIFSKTLLTVSGYFCKRSAIVFVFLLVTKTVSIYPRSGKRPKSRRLVVVWAARSYLVSPRVRLRSSLFPWTTFKTAKLPTSVDFNLPHPGLWTGFFLVRVATIQFSKKSMMFF